MTVEFKKRDYSLTSPENARAVAVGLANNDWYKTDIRRERMKQLIKRSDESAIRGTLLWNGVMITTRALARIIGVVGFVRPCFWFLGFFTVQAPTAAGTNAPTALLSRHSRTRTRSINSLASS
jgi:hypothetical protein